MPLFFSALPLFIFFLLFIFCLCSISVYFICSQPAHTSINSPFWPLLTKTSVSLFSLIIPFSISNPFSFFPNQGNGAVKRWHQRDIPNLQSVFCCYFSPVNNVFTTAIRIQGSFLIMKHVEHTKDVWATLYFWTEKCKERKRPLIWKVSWQKGMCSMSSSRLSYSIYPWEIYTNSLQHCWKC